MPIFTYGVAITCSAGVGKSFAVGVTEVICRNIRVGFKIHCVNPVIPSRIRQSRLTLAAAKALASLWRVGLRPDRECEDGSDGAERSSLIACE